MGFNNHFIYRYWFDNGKSYIGQTFGDDIDYALIRRARGNNMSGYQGCYLFWSAIKEYGVKSIHKEVIFSNLTQEEANRMEKICIQLFRTYDPKYGYNITLGGGGFDKGKNSRSKEYNQEYAREYNKKYYQANKERIKEHLKELNKKRYQTNKDYFKELNKKYHQSNKDYFKEYYQANKDYFKEYYQVNKERIKEYQREYRKRKVKNPKI